MIWARTIVCLYSSQLHFQLLDLVLQVYDIGPIDLRSFGGIKVLAGFATFFAGAAAWKTGITPGFSLQLISDGAKLMKLGVVAGRTESQALYTYLSATDASTVSVSAFKRPVRFRFQRCSSSYVNVWATSLALELLWRSWLGSEASWERF